MSNRTPFIGGNWKMNTDARTSVALGAAIAEGLDREPGIEVAVYPPFVYLAGVRGALAASDIRLGAQDACAEPNGAFTGEISIDMLRDCGVQSVLTGHSERRHIIGESDLLVNKKTRAVLDAGLQVVLCIGETLEQRESGKTDDINEHQTRAGLEGVARDQLDRVVIAYEPVWAIGTGKTASPEDAQDAHAKVRALIAEMYDADAAENIRIIYGGSMKPDNAARLMAMPDIDGGLIGGASLKADDFLTIIRSAQPNRV